MKKLTKFDVILNIWVSLIINIALSAVLPALNGFLTWGTFFSGFAIAFPVSTILVFVLPVVSWGAKFASLFKLKPNTPVFTIVSTIVLSFNGYDAAYDGDKCRHRASFPCRVVVVLSAGAADCLSVRAARLIHRPSADQKNARHSCRSISFI